MRLQTVLALLLCLGCGGDDDASDADAALDASIGAIDSGVELDAGFVDTGAADVGVDTGSDSGGSDAGSDSGGVDAGPQRVPLFVAIGWGGRHLISCDGGRSWTNDTFESEEDDWHQTFTPKSLAYHDGLFVRMTGWGTDSTVHSSRDGVNWTSVTLEGVRAGAVGYDDRWVALTGRRVYESSDAQTWNEVEGVEGARLNRDGRVEAGIWVSGTDGVVRFHRGEDWVDLESCEGSRHGSIGVHGGFAASEDRIVSFGDEGFTCVVDRTSGADLGAGEMGTDRIQGVGARIGDEFWLASNDTLYRSPDGLEWRSAALPDGVRMNLVAAGHGIVVGANRNGDAFYYSDDSGATWNVAEGPEGNNLYRIVFGWAEPSDECPL
ncbi:MAG: hypothetical protein AAF938_22675 [Myxococcota bacterium]